VAVEAQRRQQRSEEHRQQQDHDSRFTDIMDPPAVTFGIDRFACLSHDPGHDMREAGTDIEEDADRRKLDARLRIRAVGRRGPGKARKPEK
jgi:hypothetical protein